MYHVKVFTTDKDGKITLTKKELEDALEEAYQHGVRDTQYTTITYGGYNNWLTSTPYINTCTATNTTLDVNTSNTETPAQNAISYGTCTSTTHPFLDENHQMGIKIH